MKKIIITTVFIITAFFIILPAQDQEITFLSKAPLVDGKLDEELKDLPIREFELLDKGAESNKDTVASYRLAYGLDFFYLFIESNQESIEARDRGYQNGDGFHLVIAAPKEDNQPADKFYVLSFTPTDAASRKWQRSFVWYKDIDVAFYQLEKTRFKEHCQNGKAGFEVMIPWSELYPYHPGINRIGFNMCFVRALPDLQENYHYVLFDDNIQNEQSLRKYKELNFAKTPPESPAGIFVLPPKNLAQGESLNLDVFCVGNDTAVKLVLKDFLNQEVKTLELAFDGSGPETKQVNLDTKDLEQGDYTLELSGNDSFKHEFTILPQFNIVEKAEKLARIADSISSGSLATLQFNLQEVKEGLEKIDKYGDASQIRSKMGRINLAIRDGLEGKDYLSLNIISGVSRRAYRSAFDYTLQPYSLALPPGFDPAKKYPLLIWLHGSGVDDRNAPVEYLSQGGLIALGPNGRGPTTAYCRDNAQVDIREVIEEVCKEFPVDRENIILAGFSMGGYGVYRSHLETPDKFRALAVFSGHPNLSYGDIDFLEGDQINVFKGKDIFVFHGDLDRNCPIERTLKMVDKLKAAGANVEFHLQEGIGHSPAGPAIQMAFKSWVRKIVNTN